MLNQLKEEYAYARFLLYEGSEKFGDVHFADKEVNLSLASYDYVIERRCKWQPKSAVDFQIKMYDDHFNVESPGLLPGIVRVNNIREFHFSRNPKIVELLTEYDLVKEYGEGVDRIFRDMEEAGLPEPVYRQSDFMLYATLKNKNYGTDASWASISTTSGGEGGGVSGGDDKQLIVIEFCAEAHSKPEIQEYLDIKSERYVREKLINAQGLTVAQITEETGLKRASINSYLPYAHIIYNLPDISIKAERQKQYRVRKRNNARTDAEKEALAGVNLPAGMPFHHQQRSGLYV